MSTPFVALVPAAGRGLRYGQASLKQWVTVAGRPVLVWTVERLLRFGASSVVVAVPPESLDTARAALPRDGVRVIEGGANRQESVRRCFDQLQGGDDHLILVHDGVRPAVAEADVRATLAAAIQTGAAILGRSVHDTLKELDGSRVARTADRSTFFRAETPQVFSQDVLERAFEAAGDLVGTDESSLVERLDDVEIRAVEAVGANPKLTVPDQLRLIESLLS